MRTLPACFALATLFTLGVTPALAEDGPTRLLMNVGQKVTVGGASGKCDDLGVATITLDAQAVITAVKPGKTTCSARVGGLLRIYQVEVTVPLQ